MEISLYKMKRKWEIRPISYGHPLNRCNMEQTLPFHLPVKPVIIMWLILAMELRNIQEILFHLFTLILRVTKPIMLR